MDWRQARATDTTLHGGARKRNQASRTAKTHPAALGPQRQGCRRRNKVKNNTRTRQTNRKTPASASYAQQQANLTEGLSSSEQRRESTLLKYKQEREALPTKQAALSTSLAEDEQKEKEASRTKLANMRTTYDHGITEISKQIQAIIAK